MVQKIFLFLLLLYTQTTLFSLPTLEENTTIESIFKKYNINGTFILYNENNNELIGYNKKRAGKRFIPGSIFKIPNSAVALSEKIITNIGTIFYHYKGENVFLPIWTNNMSLRDAMKHSSVPAFQQIAKKVGLKKMQTYLNEFEYGNKKTGKIVDRFWLDGPLKISAVEQIIFLRILFSNKSPISSEIQNQVKEILFLEENNKWKLYGKTGWPSKVGWFVGWIEKNNQKYIFATNMDIEKFENLYLRQQITKDILTALIQD